MKNEETKIQDAIRVELSKAGIVRRNNVGTFLTVNGYPINIGLPGEADLTLFQKGGKTVFIEVKTPTGRQSKQQRVFQRRVEELGFEYIIARDLEDIKELVKKVESDGRGQT